MEGTTPPGAAEADDEAGLWYFAFGANMDTAIFVDRRGMSPASMEPAELPGYRLVFDQAGIPLIEPAFANIQAAPDDVVHGVLYRLTHDELAQLDRMEGGGDAYDHHMVDVVGRDTGPATAHAYLATRTRGGLAPSRRYRDILVRGAEQHGLPPAWVERLRNQSVSGWAWLAPLSTGVLQVFEWGFRHGINIVPLMERYWAARDWWRKRR